MLTADKEGWIPLTVVVELVAAKIYSQDVERDAKKKFRGLVSTRVKRGQLKTKIDPVTDQMMIELETLLKWLERDHAGAALPYFPVLDTPELRLKPRHGTVITDIPSDAKQLTQLYVQAQQRLQECRQELDRCRQELAETRNALQEAKKRAGDRPRK